MEDQRRFIDVLQQSTDSGVNFKLVLSKPRSAQWLKATVVVLFLEDIAYQWVEKTKTQEFTKVLDGSQLVAEVDMMLAERYFFAELLLEDKKITLLQSKKGKATLLTKMQQNVLEKRVQHNKPKAYQLAADEPFLKVLGLASSSGKIYDHSQRKFRQINKFIELIDHEIGNDWSSIQSIADMGSGKAYLTFGICVFLRHLGHFPTIVGYEVRQDLVDICNVAAQMLGYTNLHFEVASIHEVELKSTDLVIALHACDIATDMAIAKAVEAKSSYIFLSPCCHKQIRKAITKTDSMTKHGILLERQAEIITDSIRSLILEYVGYQTKVFEFISQEETSKNLMITAKLSTPNPNAKEEIESIKKQYGIDQHYLESLVDLGI